MKEVFENILEKLESEQKEIGEDLDFYSVAMNTAKDIVQEVAREYKKENCFNLDNTVLHKCPKCGGNAQHRVNQRGSWACGCFECKIFKSNYDHQKAIQEWEDYCKEYNNGWIPVTERVPDSDRYILISFENFSIPCAGRYEENDKGGAFYIGDEDAPLITQGMIVNAWMELPEPYKGE